MTQDELKLVLEALENGDVPTPENAGKNLDAITAIKEALAQTQEPVGEVSRYGRDSHGRQWHGIHWYDSNVDMVHGTKLYAQPLQRTWVGLTDEERSEIDHLALSRVQAVQMTEAKLKELNT